MAIFECPWCGPNGAPVDVTRPVHQRLCTICMGDLYTPEYPPTVPVEPLIVADLRAILRKHVRELHTVRWPGAEFGKVIIGNAILGALTAHGADAGAELRAIVAEVRP